MQLLSDNQINSGTLDLTQGHSAWSESWRCLSPTPQDREKTKNGWEVQGAHKPKFLRSWNAQFVLLLHKKLKCWNLEVTVYEVARLIISIDELQQYTVWVKKIATGAFWHFFPKGWEFLVQILQAYYMFLYTLEYKILFNYLQLWWSYAILRATTQRAFRPMVDILSIWCELCVRAKYGITSSKLQITKPKFEIYRRQERITGV